MPPEPKDRVEDAPDDEPVEGSVNGAFDLWLQRGLHTIFDSVANEPVPEELRKLIEDDRAG